MSGGQGETGDGRATGPGGGRGSGAHARRERRPAPDEYADFYGGYVDAVPDGDVVTTLERHGAELVTLLRAVPAEREDHRYAPGKWSVREIALHLADSERVFQYRAVHIARGDPAPLPDMDQDAWAEAADLGARTLADLADELAAVRASTVALFRGLPDAAWERRGMASTHEVSVRALAWMTAGHGIHHGRVLVERYGLEPPGGS